MPLTYTPEGATEPITVYTAEELAEKEKAAADKAAADAAEATRKELAADPNGVAAAARRQAEKQVKAAEKTATEAQAKLDAALADTTKSADELRAAQAEATAAKEAAAKAAGDVEAIKTEFAQKTALIEAGAKPASVAKVEALLKADNVDLSDKDAVAKALESLKTDAPGLFINAQAGGYNPSGGSHHGPNTSGITYEQAGELSPADYAAQRRKGDIT